MIISIFQYSKAILFGLALFFSAFFVGSKTIVNQPSTKQTPTPSASLIPSPATSLSPSKPPPNTPSQKTYNNNTSTSSPVTTAKNTTSPTTNSTTAPTQTSQTKPQPRCFTPTIYPSNHGIVPFKVILQANAENSAGYEWDPKGDGNWTPVSLNAVEFTYEKDGRYYVKMRTVGQDGQRSEICQTEVVVIPQISVSINGQAYKDKNCNDSKDNGEEGAPGVNLHVNRLTTNGLDVTKLVSDGSGNYSFSKNMSSPDETFELQVVADDSPGYRLHGRFVAANLSKDNRSATIDVPFVPEENVGVCAANP